MYTEIDYFLNGRRGMLQSKYIVTYSVYNAKCNRCKPVHMDKYSAAQYPIFIHSVHSSELPGRAVLLFGCECLNCLGISCYLHGIRNSKD